MSAEVPDIIDSYFKQWLEISETNNRFYAVQQVILEIERGNLRNLTNRQKKLAIETLAKKAPNELHGWADETLDRIPQPTFAEMRLCLLANEALKSSS